MKHLSIIILALCALTTGSCGSNTAGTPGDTTTADSAKPSVDNTAPSAANKGTITCIMDGKPVSINVQKGFFELPLTHDPKDPNDGFELLDGSAKKEGFQFEIKKTGVTNIDAEYGNSKGCGIGYYNSTGQLYAGTKGEITVTSHSSDHLTGTFAGKFELNEGSNKIPIQITDGKFDLLK